MLAHFAQRHMRDESTHMLIAIVWQACECECADMCDSVAAAEPPELAFDTHWAALSIYIICSSVRISSASPTVLKLVYVVFVFMRADARVVSQKRFGLHAHARTPHYLTRNMHVNGHSADLGWGGHILVYTDNNIAKTKYMYHA